MKPVKSKVAQRLIELRGEQSIYEVAKSVGIRRSVLQRYEAGERVPEDKNLDLLAAYYEVDFDELKVLVFEDLFPKQSRDRQVLKRWVQSWEK